MHRQKRFPGKSKRRFGKKSKILEIRPGADPKLKEVFSSIGVPEKGAFQPDPFQLQALSAIDRTDCLVTAPTGSGKTWIAQQAIARINAIGGKSWYASPLKALTNSKYDEFSGIFGPQNVGILTGDRKETPDAPIITGTAEILRNQLYDAMHLGETLRTDLVILDEAHFLGDGDRGVVWEEIMIYLPPRIPLLMLSATIGNAEEIAEWLISIRAKKCVIVEEKKRPVPLFPLFLHPSGKLFPLLKLGDSKERKRLNKNVKEYLSHSHPPLFFNSRKLPPFGDILRVLKKYKLVPAIFFLKSRSDCDHALSRCSENFNLDEGHKAKLRQRIEELGTRSLHIANHRQRWELEHLAVGSHHSGHLPAWKLVIERLMTEGLLDAVFATSTVAAGVNFPARSVVFLNSDKFNGREFKPLSPTEFHQMTGRAGRRGMDHIGFAVAIPGKFMDIHLLPKLIDSSSSDIVSQIKINFSMVLNLLLSHAPDQIKDLLEKSFATFQIVQTKKKGFAHQGIKIDKKYLWKDFQRHLKFLKKTGFVTDKGELTHDGAWASQLRVDQPLLIAEGFRRRIFPDTDPALLAAIMAVFVYEGNSDDRNDTKNMPKTLLNTFLTVTKGLGSFLKIMSDHGFETHSFFIRPAFSIYTWATGQPWEQTLSTADMPEGNLATLILRTADNLRQIRALHHTFPDTSETAKKSIDLLLRDPVLIDDFSLT